ncbi:substrate-binding periplasmic protein [Marinobacter sp. F4206]|uniref:substrate-binding periplasmic protein n=1 Tax=Marinobacter sp. F4206 TaxID=2861777 RepID=UPI001C5FF0DD|nr:transporter substrate-binding domain-containing protein [Marinobacter sp. F4206]MBW4935348.1 transporter substrate-binding domain-containing protein [Marinobacter sp. F4206]
MRALILMMLALIAMPVWAQQGTETIEPLTVTVGVNHAPPYRIIKNGERTGLYVEIFEGIATRLGWNVRYREAPFRRVLRLAEEGQVDIVLGPLQTEERERFLEFVAPAFPPERRLFFYQTDTHRIEGYSDLYGRVIGVLDGSSYFPRFDEDEKLMKERAPRYENLILMMEKGRVDVVIVPELVGKYIVDRLDVTARISPFFVPGERSYIAVSKKSKALAYADDIRAAFKLMEMEGTYEDLVLKYLETESP